MSEYDFTPGPWSVSLDISETLYEIQSLSGPIADLSTSDFPSDIDCPNAYLIAEAPNLLWVLEAILKDLQKRNPPDRRLDLESYGWSAIHDVKNWKSRRSE